MYCVLDLGSTKTEISFHSDGLRLRRAESFDTPFQTREGVVFIDPEPYMGKILEIIRSDPGRDEEIFFTVTGMGSTIMAVDRAGNVLVPALSWEFRVPGEDVSLFPVSRTGKMFLPTYPLYKIGWMKKRISAPDAVFLSLPDYVLSFLAGFETFRTDYSFASRSMLFDDTACEWDEELISTAGLSSHDLPVPCGAGTVIADLNPSLGRELGIRCPAHICSGMHDHVSTAYLGSLTAGGENYLTNPAGTTESLVARTGDTGLREDLVNRAPQAGVNTECSWTRDILALVTYPCLSGKIMNTARSFGVDPASVIREVLPGIVAAPARRRLVVEDRGLIVNPDGGPADMEDLWRSLILATQFEFRSALEDTLGLLKTSCSGVLLFGGQARNGMLCRLKSAVIGLPVRAFPGINGASLGAAARIAAVQGREIDLSGALSTGIFHCAENGEMEKFQRYYERYRAVCAAAEKKESIWPNHA